MDRIGKVLIIIGIIAIIIGVILRFSEKFPGLGKLPGDFTFRKGSFTLYFPLTTSVLVSAIISLLLYILNRMRF